MRIIVTSVVILLNILAFRLTYNRGVSDGEVLGALSEKLNCFSKLQKLEETKICPLPKK